MSPCRIPAWFGPTSHPRSLEAINTPKLCFRSVRYLVITGTGSSALCDTRLWRTVHHLPSRHTLSLEDLRTLSKVRIVRPCFGMFGHENNPKYQIFDSLDARSAFSNNVRDWLHCLVSVSLIIEPGSRQRKRRHYVL